MKAQEIHFLYDGEFDFTLPSNTTTNNSYNQNQNHNRNSYNTNNNLGVQLPRNTQMNPNERGSVVTNVSNINNNNKIPNTSTTTVTTTTTSSSREISSSNNNINEILKLDAGINNNTNNNRYRSINSKRVFESMNITIPSSLSTTIDEDTLERKKKQITEHVYQLWKKQTQEKIDKKKQQQQQQL